jgi:hypothetical protein
MTYQSAEQLCKFHRSSWLKHVRPDLEIYSGGEDKGFWSPPGAAQLKTGRDAYPDPHINSTDRNMPKRLASSIADAYARGARSVTVIEPDVWFWREPPLNDGITGRVFQEANGAGFIHWPLILSGPWGKKFAEAALGCASRNESSVFWGSFPDRFAYYVARRFGVPTHDGHQVSFNTIENEEQMKECLDMRERGAYAVHGIKNLATLTRLAI